MRNRAKCKLCESIIESFHSTDMVQCKCGEISVDGGEALYCAAKDWHNFLRVDDMGNIIIPKIKTKEEVNPIESSSKPTKKELLDILDCMVKNMEELPQNALVSSINHYDLLSVLILLSSIFRADCKEEI